MVSERAKKRVERLLDQIDEASEQSDWETVRERAKDVLALEPENVDGKTFLAAAERRLVDVETTDEVEPSSTVRTPPVATTTESYPTSFANGRYQVKEFLGEGGKKRVYLAHDSVLDRDVALAVIKTEGLDETSRSRVTREARAMGRLGDHPHVLQIFDLGEDNGQPYMVLPLMPGGVDELLERAEDHRLSLEQAIDLAVQVCRGLDHAHSHGVVHRDLKPGNVWLTADGIAKIGDFGLAVVIDRSRLTQEGMMVGTVSYMPPEQAMGGDVTERADLYSFGAMLYEMVCGRPPFLGDDSVAIIGQHINTSPVAPTWHRQECPRALEALIMRLLAKDPSERPESATDVLTALEGIDLTLAAEERTPEFDEAHALDSLAGGVFVGRQKEMGELKAALEDTLSGRGRMVTLVGEPGIGKTRTAQELATYARLRGAQILWGRCYEEQGVPPYWPWVQVIRSYVRERDPEQLRSEMGTGAADIAEIVSDVRERLPGLQPPPSLDSPEEARFRLFDAVTTFLRTAGQRQPLMLVLDDLHWADNASLLLLQFLARELANARLLLIGTYRDVELSRQHPLAETLGELTRERLFQRVLLRGLAGEDVGRFMEITSGVTPPQGLVTAVHTQTEGNLLFVTEVVRLLVQEGELTRQRSEGRDSWTVRIPEGVREVIGRRLNRLSGRCNEVLTIASVIGREFTLDQLGRLVDDLSQDMLLDVLEEALSARLVEEVPTDVGRYQFTHALIQETLAGELSLTRRVRLHARIGETLEALYGASADAHAAQLAHHFAQAEAVVGSGKLVRYSLVAGERALASYGYEEARAHFARALAAKEGQPMDAETADILFGLGRAQSATLESVEMRDALDTLSLAFDYYAEVNDVERALAVAEHHFWGTPGLLGGMVELVGRALQMVPSDSHEEGRLLARYGFNLGREAGDYEGAREAFDRALAIARRDQDALLEMRTVAYAAEVDEFHFHYQDALEKGLRAIELARDMDDPFVETQARFRVAVQLFATGDLEGARLQAEAAVVAAERARNRNSLVEALWASARVCTLQGQWRTARELNERALQMAPHGGRLLSQRVLLDYEAGDFTQGQAYLDRMLEALRIREAGGTDVAIGLEPFVMACVSRFTGDVDRFEVDQAASEAVISSPSALPLSVMTARLGLALMAVQREDVAAAQQHYAEMRSAAGTIFYLSYIGNDHILGLLAQTMGRLDDAVAHFEDALAFCRKGGYLPELAWTCCDYADTLRQRNDPGDREQAASLLDESLSASRELGMRPLMERVLSRREILQA